jgi:hypothetical protein
MNAAYGILTSHKRENLMKNLFTITVLMLLFALSGCISIRSGGSPGPQGSQGPAGTTERVIIVPAGSSSSSSNAGMTNEGRAVFDGRQDSKTWEFDNLEFQGAEWITYIDNLSLSVSERGDMVTWHASFDVRSRVQKTVSPDVVFTLILLDRNGQELAPSGQISFNRTCGNSYYEKSDSAIAPGLFKRAAGARIRYIFKTRVIACGQK